jgi:Flp pilus assembly CpaF family ATPase
MLYERSPETGTILRNVLHWEAADLSPEAAKDPTTQTMGNFMAHTLRNTPDVVIPGEVRTPQEFFQMYKIMKTGHRVLTTFHAGGAANAIERMATELATLGGSIEDYKKTLVHSLDIIVSQQKLGDGSRHVNFRFGN